MREESQPRFCPWCGADIAKFGHDDDCHRPPVVMLHVSEGDIVITPEHRAQIQDDDRAALDLIAIERRRQIELGYTLAHDDLHDPEQFSSAAVAYLLAESSMWPWDEKGFISANDGKPIDSLQERLIKAGALIVAAIGTVRRA
jgi:hypothetical protein